MFLHSACFHVKVTTTARTHRTAPVNFHKPPLLHSRHSCKSLPNHIELLYSSTAPKMSWQALFTSFRFISLHFTSFHFFSLHFTSFHFVSFCFATSHAVCIVSSLLTILTVCFPPVLPFSTKIVLSFPFWT